MTKDACQGCGAEPSELHADNCPIRAAASPRPFEVPACRVTYTINISQGRSLGFETMVEQGIANEDLDELLDRVTRSYNRQQAILELPELERHLKLTQDQARKTARDLVAMREEYNARHEQSTKRNPRLTDAQKATIDQMEKSIEQYDLEIGLRKEAIAKAKAMIGHTNPNLALAAE